MVSVRVAKVHALELRAREERDAHRRAQARLAAEIREEQESLVYEIIAENPDRLWNAKGVDDALRAEGMVLEPGDLQTILESGVRHRQLTRSGSTYQLTRPGVLVRHLKETPRVA